MDHQSHEPARFWYYYDFSPLQPGRYYCGDCFQLLPAIESGTVDMVLIDPPYYMGKDKAWDCFEGRADYMAFMGRAFIQAQRILKENGTLGFWHNDLQKITWLCDWLGIYNVLRRCGATVVAYIDGVAASAASVIAMAADKVIMPRNTAIMVHNAAWGVYGNSKELRKSADDLDIINGAMLQSYIVKAGDKLPAEKLEELTDGETWATVFPTWKTVL